MGRHHAHDAADAAGLAAHEPPAGHAVDGLVSLGPDTDAAAAVDPQKQTPPGEGGAAGERGKEHAHCERSDLQRKQFEGLRAQLAIAGGICLYDLADGSYLAAQGCYTRHMSDLHAVAAFVRQVTGGRA